MTNSSPAAAQYADTGGLISTRLARIDREPPAVIDLASPMHTGWRPGAHRREAEAALSLFEDVCMEPGGEKIAWHYAVCALVHALLDLGERL